VGSGAAAVEVGVEVAAVAAAAAVVVVVVVPAASAAKSAWWHRHENKTVKSRSCQPDVDVRVGEKG
jgi:hypothetical protein